jgi:hypothetical protein
MGDVNDPDCCRRSFAASIKDTARRLLEDPSVAPRAVANDRLAICEACDRYMPESGQCEICLCYMKLKCAMSNMECPIGKWTTWKKDTDTTFSPDT